MLHVEPAGCIIMPRDLVHALAKLGVRIGREPSAHALIGSLERVAAVFAEIVATGRDAEVHAVPITNDRVHAEAAVAGLPLACVLVVADAGHQLPRIAAVSAPEQRRRFDTAPQFFLAGPRLN